MSVMKNEIVCADETRAMAIAGALMAENYVVMVSKEERFTVINYEWSETHANRNDVVFAHKQVDECPKDLGFEKCYECKHGCYEYESMKDEEYELPEG